VSVGLIGAGELSYNGVDFGGTTTLNVHVVPAEDEAGRTTVYQMITLRVVSTFATVSGGTSLDDQVNQIRYLLNQHGKELVLDSKGFGTLRVSNQTYGGFVADLKFGPKPRVLSWHSLGGSGAAEIEWEVTVCVPPCSEIMFGIARSRTGILAANYQVMFDINERGITTRTIDGYLEIACNKLGVNPSDIADAYREKIISIQLPGFNRRTRWNLSLDKSRLDFTIVDTQIETKFPFPAYIMAPSGRHRVSWARSQGGMMKLRNTISMDLPVGLGVGGTPWVNQAYAYWVFASIVRQRIYQALTLGQSPVIMDELVIEEDIWGTASSFSVSYTSLAKLADIIKASGVWMPIDTGYQNTWDVWHTSTQEYHDYRGQAGLFVSRYDDAIINICDGAQYQAPRPNQKRKGRQQTQSNVIFRNQVPPPSQSWLEYNTSLGVQKTKHTSRQQVLQEPEDAEQAPGNQNAVTGWKVPKTGQREADIIQQSGIGAHTAVLTGVATRVGYEVARPSLIRVGTQTAVLKEDKFVTRDLGDHLGVRVYRTAWRQVYELVDSPDVVKSPVNLRG
jgi:hypothetical protein